MQMLTFYHTILLRSFNIRELMNTLISKKIIKRQLFSIIGTKNFDVNMKMIFNILKFFWNKHNAIKFVFKEIHPCKTAFIINQS